jgi:hypothetical protein
MQLYFTDRKRRGPVQLAAYPHVAQQVSHRGRLQQFRRAQRQANRAELLFDLTRATGIEREVTGIVRTRRQLVYQQSAVARHEQLHAQHTYVLERFEHITRRGDGRAGCLWRQAGRRHRNIEDVVPVHVFHRIEMSDHAIDTSSGDDRDLAIERDERFEDGFLTSKRLPRAGRVGGVKC